MIQWFLATRVGRWLAIAGAIVVAALAVRWKWMADGRRQAEDAARDRLEHQRKEARDVEDAVRRMGDPGVHDELRRDWSR